MSDKMQPGSATGNPKNKVALGPGKSLMDWIRLGNSGTDMSGTKGKIINVTKEELGKHNKKEDAWIALRGKVYNITKYFDFHPGGVDELMKGAGIEATSLFDKVHPWVNYESLLRPCLVGNLISGDVYLTTPSQGTSLLNIPKSKTPIKQSPDKQLYPPQVNSFDWYQKIDFVVFVFHLNQPLTKLHINKKTQGELWAYMENMWIGWKLNSNIEWPPNVSLILSKLDMSLEIKIKKSLCDPWGLLSHLTPGNKPPPPMRTRLKIKEIRPINHNVYIIGLTYVDFTYNYIPVGYHLTLQANINGVDIERQYTPVSHLLADFSFDVTLMIKSYPEGVFSTHITSLKVNDIVTSLMPTGSFHPAVLSDVTNLFLLAAGTGFTPMVRLIQWSLHLKKLVKLKLLFFNRTEKDIIWKEELNNIAEFDTRFSVEHILSQPDPTWTGRQGWLTLQKLQSEIPDFTKEIPLPYFVCVCGPIAFSQLAERYLHDMNYDSDHYFCFRG